MGTGTIPVLEIESGRQTWLNAGNSAYRQQLNDNFMQVEKKLETLCKKNKMDMLSVNTQEDYIPVLENYFKKRNRLKA